MKLINIIIQVYIIININYEINITIILTYHYIFGFLKNYIFVQFRKIREMFKISMDTKCDFMKYLNSNEVKIFKFKNL